MLPEIRHALRESEFAFGRKDKTVRSMNYFMNEEGATSARIAGIVKNVFEFSYTGGKVISGRTCVETRGRKKDQAGNRSLRLPA
jgi:hypothetical protein